MPEKWNIGQENMGDVLILISDHGHLDNIRSQSAKPDIPKFHYSSIPWHSITA